MPLRSSYVQESDWEAAETDLMPHAETYGWHTEPVREWHLWLASRQGAVQLRRSAQTTGLARSNHEVAQRFEDLATKWRAATRFESNLERIVLNRNYQQIIGLGPQAVPLILREMKDTRGQWFWALSMIIGEDKAAGQKSVGAATEAWLAWGRAAGLIDD